MSFSPRPHTKQVGSIQHVGSRRRGQPNPAGGALVLALIVLTIIGWIVIAILRWS